MTEKENIFEKIPTDVLYGMLNYLNIKNLSQLTRTCKYIHSIMQNKYPWHNQLLRMFGIVSCKKENSQLSIKFVHEFENNFYDCFTSTREKRPLLEEKFSNLFENGENWASVYSTYIRLTDAEFELKNIQEIFPLLTATKLGLEYFKSNEKQLSGRFINLLRSNLRNFSSVVFSHFDEQRENYLSLLQNDFKHLKLVKEQVSMSKSNLDDEFDSDNFDIVNYLQVILNSYKNKIDILTSFPDDLMNYCKRNDPVNFEKIQSEHANIKNNLNDLRSHYNRYEAVIDITRVLLSLVQTFKLIQPHVEAESTDQPVIMGIFKP